MIRPPKPISAAALALVLAAAVPAAAANADPEGKVAVGDAAEVALAALGDPRGTISDGRRTIYFFDRGDVTVADGVVTAFDLVSQEEFERVEAARQAAREAAAERAERIRLDRMIRGESIRDDKRTDPRFLAASGEDRLRYWRQFQISYPEVDITAEMADALQDFEAVLAERERISRIADLEYRVALAERRAEQAERNSRNRRSIYDYGSLYPFRSIYYSRGPVIAIGGGHSHGGTVIRGGTQATPHSRTINHRGGVQLKKGQVVPRTATPRGSTSPAPRTRPRTTATPPEKLPTFFAAPITR